MSRGYRVRIPRRQATAKATASDAIELTIDLLPILAPDAMRVLLGDQLEADGWTRGPSGVLTRTVEGVKVAIDPKTGSVKAAAKATTNVSATGVDKSDAKNNAKAKAERAKDDLAHTIDAKLAKVEADVHGLVQQSVQSVYVQALKQKAASLGTVTSINEQRADGELDLTITIEV